MEQTRIVVAGAGAIGCFVGGLLSAAGRDVALLGRAWLADELGAHGLTCTDFDGLEVNASPVVAVDPEVLAQADIVLVCVKSGATGEIGRLIAGHAPERAVVVSLQNGVRNVDLLQRALPGRDVRAGMVGFNVVALGQGRFHRSTSGEVLIGSRQGDLSGLLAAPGLDLREEAEIEAVQWGKLLLNLTNAVNALSGLPLREMLLDRGWRRVMAAQMEEGVRVLRAAKIAARVPAKAPGWAIPLILRLPTGLFQRVAAPMLIVDAEARTSMVVDLEAGRTTEIDEFQGEVVRLGGRHGVATPMNARVMADIRAVEAGGPLPRGPGVLLA